MTPQAFVDKWSQIRLKEITTAQSHFLDVCQLVGHKAPLDAYGWPHHLTDEQILDHLLALNLERAATQEEK